MRDYAIVPTKFWITPLAKALRGNTAAQVVALYLKTGPHANMIGLYHCPVAYIAQDTGIPIEGASKALASLSEADYCTFDESSDVVFVHDMAPEQIGATLAQADKRTKAVLREWLSVPSDRLRRAFHLRYAAPFHLPPMPDGAELGGVALMPLASRIEGPSEPHRSQEQEQEQEHDHSVLRTALAERVEAPADSRTGAEAAATHVLEQVAVMDRKDGDPLRDEDEKLLWSAGRFILADAGIKADAAGRFLGKLVKDCGNDRVLVFDAMRAACLERPVDPRGWITATCQRMRGERAPENKQTALEKRNFEAADRWAAGHAANNPQMTPATPTESNT
ncbi:MAG: hypothetical protein EOP81_02225 [Variovorax sp.]|nr:MAG: hypothetical protein EOP81_02225 [Variovorax sp.]